jgi:nucleoside-diphosphate-sugar epimerase
MTLGNKVLVAGATGQVGFPVALALAAQTEVWALARFTDADARRRLEEAGVRCVAADLASGDLSGVPADFTQVANFSVLKSNNWDVDLDANVGGVGSLMNHCRGARAFLHCSSTGVYQPNGHRAFVETDPLGDNHRVWSFLSTYSICRIATEAMARWCARQLQLPTTIARLNVPYGENGWPAMHLEMLLGGHAVPVHTDAPSLYNPIHDDDVAAMVPKMLDIASVPATIVNWGGDDAVSIEDWCTYLGKLVGVEPSFQPTDQTIESVTVDVSKMHELVGHPAVGWQDGFRRMVEARHPEALR